MSAELSRCEASGGPTRHNQINLCRRSESEARALKVTGYAAMREFIAIHTPASVEDRLHEGRARGFRT
jgi:hypothetical protein